MYLKIDIVNLKHDSTNHLNSFCSDFHLEVSWDELKKFSKL